MCHRRQDIVFRLTLDRGTKEKAAHPRFRIAAVMSFVRLGFSLSRRSLHFWRFRRNQLQAAKVQTDLWFVSLHVRRIERNAALSLSHSLVQQ